MAQGLKANRVASQKADTLAHLAKRYEVAVAHLENLLKTMPNDAARIARARENVANLEKYKSAGK